MVAHNLWLWGENGILTRRTLALGFKPVGPSSAEYAVGGFETQANHKTEATLGGLVDKSFKRSKSVVYIGDL